MKYRGHYIWAHVVQTYAFELDPEIILLDPGVEDGYLTLRKEFEFESDLTDWNDLRPLILQIFEDQASHLLPDITVSYRLCAIHLEEAKE